MSTLFGTRIGVVVALRAEVAEGEVELAVVAPTTDVIGFEVVTAAAAAAVRVVVE